MRIRGGCVTFGADDRDQARIIWSNGEYPEEPVEYSDAVREMESRVDGIRNGSAGESVWLLEHPPLYTAGTSANPADLLNSNLLPVYKSSRGGQYTYHGTGQRIAYAMLDLNCRGRDVRQFVHSIERWAIAALSDFGIEGKQRIGRIGVWVVRRDLPPLPGGVYREDKIAAIGIRIRRWISFHGMSINVAPDLDNYAGIIPCGIRGHGITSLKDMGIDSSTSEIDLSLQRHFESTLGPRSRSTDSNLVFAFLQKQLNPRKMNFAASKLCDENPIFTSSIRRAEFFTRQ